MSTSPKTGFDTMDRNLRFDPMDTITLAVRGVYILLFIESLGPEASILGTDPSQTLVYGLQLSSVKFSASGVRQVSRSKISNTQDWTCYVYTKLIGPQAFGFGSRPTPKAQQYSTVQVCPILSFWRKSGVEIQDEWLMPQ